MGLFSTVGTAVGVGKQVVSTGSSLFGGGGGPDPSGTRSVGSGQQTATIFEDRTDQSGSDPAKVNVKGTGEWNFNRIGGQGFWRAVSVRDGFRLIAEGLSGQRVTITGPTGGKVNLRDRGLIGADFSRFTVERADTGGGGGFGGGGAGGGFDPGIDPGGGGFDPDTDPDQSQRAGGTSQLTTLIVVGALVWLVSRAFASN